MGKSDLATKNLNMAFAIDPKIEAMFYTKHGELQFTEMMSSVGLGLVIGMAAGGLIGFRVGKWWGAAIGVVIGGVLGSLAGIAAWADDNL